MTDISRGARGRKHPRNPGQLDLVESPELLTKSLLHFNGADASTSFIDETGKTWSRTGSPAIYTSQYKFGGASGFIANGENIYTADHDDFHLSNVDWTFDFWLRPWTSIQSAYNVFSQVVDANNWMDIWIGGTGTKLYFQHNSGGAVTASFEATLSTLVADIWYHFAIERNGSTAIVALDGVLQTVTQTTTISGKTFSNLGAQIAIGSYGVSTGSLFNAYIDEFRFTKGFARWTSNFTPPSSEYILD